MAYVQRSPVRNMDKSKPPSTQSKTDTDSNETLQDEQANKKRSKRMRPNSSPNKNQAVGLPISPSDLRDVYRLPGKTSTTRPIIVDFSTVLRKQQLLSFVRKCNNQKLANDKLNTKLIGLPGNQKPVYIEEKIPSRTKKLYLQAREFRKKNKYAFCWCSNGNIFLRKKEGDKQIIIRSEQCLVGLQKNIL
ncbi:unnamed protein product [Leptidea sinapis]|uniref:FP protein C-terminal domain-containing protein n=1 Tax=Leptidea sinapis TaxID=189913 RepID=A0A5E4PNZ6_9NEOP|nr:unnamed protein product [Leptidea sinapis]